MPFLGYGCVNLRHAVSEGHIGIGLGESAAQRIKPVAHAADAGEQVRNHERSHRLAVLVDHDAAVAVLDLVENLAEILAEVDGADLSYRQSLRS